MSKLLKIALSQAGLKEIYGKEDNPEILKYFDELGFNGSKLKDETSWCAAGLNWALKKAGLPYQNTLNARSFLNIGEETKTPKVGDICILWREDPKSWKGHVGIYLREDNQYVWLYGANQANQWGINAFYKNRVLGYIKVE